MALFTAETARIAGLKSVEARRILKERPLVNPINPPDCVPDPFTDALASACGETLKELREKIAQHKSGNAAQLARALRDLRETWHMATGKPKPGMTRPEAGPQRRAVMPRVWPTAPSPGPAPTTNGTPEPAPDANLPKP